MYLEGFEVGQLAISIMNDMVQAYVYCTEARRKCWMF